MTIKDFNSKLNAACGTDTLVDSVRNFVGLDDVALRAFEDAAIALGWISWTDGGGVQVNA